MFVSLVAVGYGFAVGGVTGALTGLVAAVGTGSGLAIALAEGGTGVAARGLMRSGQRAGGLLAATGCILAVYFGGWTWGWAWGIAGYAGGTVMALALWALLRVSAPDDSTPSSSSPVAQLPTAFDLDDTVHVEIIEDVRRKFAETLQNESGPYAGCMYRPSSSLPYPKPVIRAAFTALLDFAAGRRESAIMDVRTRTAEVVDHLEAALVHLDDFLDVASDRLPTDPLENARVGLGLQQKV